MKIVITGGFGFLVQRLASALLERGNLKSTGGEETSVQHIVLFDQRAPDSVPFAGGARVSIVVGDISDGKTVDALIDQDDLSVFHFASIVSGEGERNFDGAMRVKFDGGMHVLEALRARGGYQNWSRPVRWSDMAATRRVDLSRLYRMH